MRRPLLPLPLAGGRGRGGAAAGEAAAAAAGAAMLRSLGPLLCLWALRLPALPAGTGAAARGLDVASYRWVRGRVSGAGRERASRTGAEPGCACASGSGCAPCSTTPTSTTWRAPSPTTSCGRWRATGRTPGAGRDRPRHGASPPTAAGPGPGRPAAGCPRPPPPGLTSPLSSHSFSLTLIDALDTLLVSTSCRPPPQPGLGPVPARGCSPAFSPLKAASASFSTAAFYAVVTASHFIDWPRSFCVSLCSGPGGQVATAPRLWHLLTLTWRPRVCEENILKLGETVSRLFSTICN